MTPEIQSQKLSFIQEYLRLNDETIINKLMDILHYKKSKKVHQKPIQMNEDELIAKLARSEKAIKEGRLMSQPEIKEYFNIK